MGRIELEKPDLPIVMLSTCDNPAFVARAAAMGASGFLLKGCTRDDLINAITKAAKCESIFTREELCRVTASLATPRVTADIEVPLTEREVEVLRHMTMGLTNKEIGIAMHIGNETIKDHVQNILRKIGLIDRAQAAVWAVRKGLVRTRPRA